MRIIYLGSGEFGSATLQALYHAGYDIPLIVTQPPRPAGRGRRPLHTPIHQLTESLNLPCLPTDNVNEPAIVNKIIDLQPELILVIAFGQKIGADLLKIPGCHVCNLHASLLPKYRGAAPINWAIINGDTHSGLTFFELDENWDSGAVWGQLETEIAPGETASELHDRLAKMAPPFIENLLKKIAAGQSQPEIQQHTQSTRAPKLKKTDGAIDFSGPARKISCQIAGMWSWPGAYCFLHQQDKDKPQRLTIARACVIESDPPDPDLTPGAFNNDMTVICGRDRLRLEQVKPDGGKLMAFTDFVNGRHLTCRDRLING